MPHAPDASEVLCEAHSLPLIPPHLESYLRGETLTLLGGNSASALNVEEGVASMPRVAAAAAAAAPALQRQGSRTNADAEMLQALRAAGLTEAEVHAQRVAMAGIEDNMRRANIHGIQDLRADNAMNDAVGQQQQQDRTITNEQLDRENRVVVEILTDDEVTALEKWWPRCHGGTYALRFAVVEGSAPGRTEILWSTIPCRECDPSSRSTANFVVRNRLQKRGYR